MADNDQNAQPAPSSVPAEKPAASKSGPKKANSKRKTARDFKRFEKKREAMSARNDKDIKEALYEQLFFGYKNVNEALKTIPLALAPRTLVIPVTTRAIGFIVRHFISKVSRLQMPNINVQPLCNALYRVSLLQLDIKLISAMEAQSSRNIGGDAFEQLFMAENFKRAILGMGAGVAPLVNLIHSIGYVKTTTTAFLPRFAVCRPNDPSNVRFGNLRNVVYSLANNASQVVRRHFYEHNPIPGAIWRVTQQQRRRGDGRVLVDDIELVNPDDIMPADYDINSLREDIDIIADAVEKIGRKYPKYISTGAMDYSGNGSLGQLVSSEVIPIRCPTYNPGDQGTIKSIVGEYDHFWSIRALSEPEFFMGVVYLTGECFPGDQNMALAPRRKQAAEQEGNLDYATVLQNLMN